VHEGDVRVDGFLWPSAKGVVARLGAIHHQNVFHGVFSLLIFARSECAFTGKSEPGADSLHGLQKYFGKD
jgi:hypothetical protein